MISLQPSDEALYNATPVSRNLFGLSAFPSEEKNNKTIVVSSKIWQEKATSIGLAYDKSTTIGW
jgi:hypothetical protein